MNPIIYDHIVSFFEEDELILHCPSVLDIKVISTIHLQVSDNHMYLVNKDNTYRIFFSCIDDTWVPKKKGGLYDTVTQRTVKRMPLEFKAMYYLFSRSEYFDVLFPIFSKYSKTLLEMTSRLHFWHALIHKNWSLLKYIVTYYQSPVTPLKEKDRFYPHIKQMASFLSKNYPHAVLHLTRNGLFPFIGTPEQEKDKEYNLELKKEIFFRWKVQTQDMEEKLYLVKPYMQYLFFSYGNHPVSNAARKMYQIISKCRLRKIPNHISMDDLNHINTEIKKEISPIGLQTIKENVFHWETCEHYSDFYMGQYLIKLFQYLIKIKQAATIT